MYGLGLVTRRFFKLCLASQYLKSWSLIYHVHNFCIIFLMQLFERPVPFLFLKLYCILECWVFYTVLKIKDIRNFENKNKYEIRTCV